MVGPVINRINPKAVVSAITIPPAIRDTRHDNKNHTPNQKDLDLRNPEA
jgi:hypothetical protein